MTHEIKVPTYKNRPELSRPAKLAKFPGQHEGEEIELIFRRHPVVMRRGVIFACLSVLIGILPTLVWPSYQVYFGGLAVGLLFGGIVFFFPAWVRWYFSVFIVTSERLVQVRQLGFFSKQVEAMFHARIHGLNYSEKGFFPSLMHYGTISVLTEVGNFDIQDVPHPEELHEKILECVRDHIGEDD